MRDFDKFIGVLNLAEHFFNIIQATSHVREQDLVVDAMAIFGNPDEANSFIQFADALLNAERFSSAETILQALVKIAPHPDTPSLFYRLGNALYGQGKYDEAEREYIRTNNLLEPDEYTARAACLARLAQAQEAQKKLPEAKRSIVEAITAGSKIPAVNESNRENQLSQLLTIRNRINGKINQQAVRRKTL